MFDLNKVLACPKCGEMPEMVKNEKSVEKRYGFRCPTEHCGCNSWIFGDTKSIAAANWNQFVSKNVKSSIQIRAEGKEKGGYVLVTGPYHHKVVGET